MFNNGKNIDKHFWDNYKKEIFNKAYDRGILKKNETFLKRFLKAKIYIPAPVVAALTGILVLTTVSFWFVTQRHAEKSITMATHELNATSNEKKGLKKREKILTADQILGSMRPEESELKQGGK